jgi:hypothetical protein
MSFRSAHLRYLWLFFLVPQISKGESLSYLVLDDFEIYPLATDTNADPMTAEIPQGWEEFNLKDGVKDYAVLQQGAEKFLRGKFIPKTKGKVFFKKIEWNLDEFPLITWRWRIGAWATGSTVKKSSKEDSSAAFYVSVKSGIKNYILKYIWAVDDPLDSGYSKGKWNPTGALEAIVIRSGGNLNEWQTETRNIREDFKKLYKKDLPSTKATGIGVLTEGDGTETTPQADYDDIRALKPDLSTEK